MGRAVVVDTGSVVLSPDDVAARWVFVEFVDQVVKLVFGSHVSLHRPISPWPGVVCGRAWSQKGREYARQLARVLAA